MAITSKRLDVYLPIEFLPEGSDGLYGKTPDDGGAIYVYDLDDYSETFQEVLVKTSIKELIEQFEVSIFYDELRAKDLRDGDFEMLNKLKLALLSGVEQVDQILARLNKLKGE